MNDELEQEFGQIVVKNKEGHRKKVKISDYNEFQKNPIEGHHFIVINMTLNGI